MVTTRAESKRQCRAESPRREPTTPPLEHELTGLEMEQCIRRTQRTVTRLLAENAEHRESAKRREQLMTAVHVEQLVTMAERHLAAVNAAETARLAVQEAITRYARLCDEERRIQEQAHEETVEHLKKEIAMLRHGHILGARRAGRGTQSGRHKGDHKGTRPRDWRDQRGPGRGPTRTEIKIKGWGRDPELLNS